MGTTQRDIYTPTEIVASTLDEFFDVTRDDALAIAWTIVTRLDQHARATLDLAPTEDGTR